MNSSDPKQIIESFWVAMQTNDFKAAAELLHDDYVLEWPQSGERIRGRANFVAVNENYPAHGRWNFSTLHLLVERNEAVTDVKVTDDAIHARVITFSSIQYGKIIHQVEFWPDPFEPAIWRKAWVERIETKE